MSVTERMRSLGEHAKSSRQPPLKERRHAKASESAAKTVDLDEDIFDNSAPRDSAVAALVDDVAPQVAVHESGNGGATQAVTVQEDEDTSAAKRAIIHEWENWSALHSDELQDPNVSEYFFRHLQAKMPHIVNFVDYNCDAVRNWLRDYRST